MFQMAAASVAFAGPPRDVCWLKLWVNRDACDQGRQMAGFLKSLTEQYREQVERHKNLPFLKATMASCAVVATADGKVSFTERVRVDQIMATLEQLQIFDPHEGVDLFLEFAEHILMAPKDGHDRALEALEWVRDEPETAKLIIRICLAVAESNGDTSLTDQIEIVTLCSRLGVEPSEYGIYHEDLLEQLKLKTRAD